MNTLQKIIIAFILLFLIQSSSFAQDDYCYACDNEYNEEQIITMDEWSKNYQMTETERQDFLDDYYNNPDAYWSFGVRKLTPEEQEEHDRYWNEVYGNQANEQQNKYEQNDDWRESSTSNQGSLFQQTPSQEQQEDQYYYQNLIGKTREYIEAVFPYYTQFKQIGNKFNNFYILDSAECEDGGTVVLLVGFDGKKYNSVVNNVSMFVQGCRDYIGNDDIYAAGILFSNMLGLIEYADETKVINETDDGFVIIFPNSVNTFAQIEKEKSYNQWNYYITGTFKPSRNK